MDFHNVLNIASEKQGLSSVTKRYSLTPGPPKRDPKVKGVNSAAVQAFLKKRETEQKHKELEKKRQKDELLAKRVELKSDRKARAMASRTKDNFRGYNGIPVVEQPKKRQRKSEKSQEHQDNEDSYFDEDNYEYAASDSESEQDSFPVRPQEHSIARPKINSVQKKNHIPPKAAPPLMNFADLLKLAEKKQFEPVELKPTKKVEERLRTAEEIKELEIEHKVRRKDNMRNGKTDKSLGKKDGKHGTNFPKKNGSDREIRESKSHKTLNERLSIGISKMSNLRPQSDQSAKLSHGDRSKLSALSSKTVIKGTPSSVKHVMPRPQSAGKPTNTSSLSTKKLHPGLPQAKMNTSRSQLEPAFRSSKLSSSGQSSKGYEQVRPSQNSSSKGGPTQKLSRGEVSRPSGTPPSRPCTDGQMRSLSSGSKQAGTPQLRPGGSSHGRPVPGGPKGFADRSNKPNRPLTSMGQGPGRPQCTVVSETISSKNFSAKPGMPSRPAAPQGPKTIIGPTGHRILVKPAGPMLPPITSSYKRGYDDDEEEFDSEMDDFIDDEEEGQDEVSKHIKEIFGYDRSKYKDESDYALKFMESSWKEQQKEEARSLRLGIKEDEEELRKEEEEMRQQQFKKAKRKRT